MIFRFIIMEDNKQNLLKQEIITENLKQQLKEFKQVCMTMKDQNLDVSMIKQAIEDLEQQITSKTTFRTSKKPNERYIKGINKIFGFYAKQQKFVKHRRSFEDYDQDSKCL